MRIYKFEDLFKKIEGDDYFLTLPPDLPEFPAWWREGVDVTVEVVDNRLIIRKSPDEEIILQKADEDLRD